MTTLIVMMTLSFVIRAHALTSIACISVVKKDFLNMEFAFKYGIWEFLIHNLTPETQLLTAIGYETCFFYLILYVPSTIFQLNRDGSSWVEPVLN